jgi:hypothetical protein
MIAASPIGAKMDVNAVYVKTEKGEEEIRSRAHKVPQRLRTMLIMVDGAVTASELTKKAKSLAVPDDFMEYLLQGGFIELAIAAPSAPATVEKASAPAAPAEPMGADEFSRFISAQKFMNGTVSDALGFRGLPLVLKIERASSRTELLALVDELSEKLSKALGPLRAKGIIEQLTGLLS